MFGWLKKTISDNKKPAQEFAPIMPLSLSDSEFIANPYPTYSWLRAHQPVCELEGGGYLLTRYQDVRSALTSPDLGNAPSRFSTLSARNVAKYTSADLASHIPPFLDGSLHIEMRQMVSRAFFDCFNALDQSIAKSAQEYVKNLSDGDDLITTAAQPFALQVMCHFCGLTVNPSEMKSLSQAFFHLFAPLRDPDVFAEVNNALDDFRAVIERSLTAGSPQGSFLAALRRFQSDHETISDAHIVDNCLLVFANGIENIEAGAALLLASFAEFEVRDAIQCGAIPIERAVREGLRLHTPAQLIPRVARTECEIGGVVVKKDMPVFLALASANRDAAMFVDPDQFDATRDAKKYLTFGQGRHRCIGEPLAMLQLTSLLHALIEAGVHPAEKDHEFQLRVGHRWPQIHRIKKY